LPSKTASKQKNIFASMESQYKAISIPIMSNQIVAIYFKSYFIEAILVSQKLSNTKEYLLKQLYCSLLSGSLTLEALLIGVHYKKRYINV